MDQEELKKIKQEIISFEEKNNKKMSKEEKIEFIENLKKEKEIIQGIICKSQNHFELKKLKTFKIESLQFYYSPNNVSEFPEGYFTCETLSDYLKFLDYKNVFHCKSNHTVYYELNSEKKKIVLLPKDFYLTLVIPQLNWKKELPIIYSEVNAFELSEEITVPVSCISETNLNFFFKTPDSNIIKESEINFNIKYTFY